MKATIKIQKFTVKDMIFLAILSAALVIAGMVTMPLVMSVTLFGLRNMVSAILYSLFTILGLMKVKKAGTLSFIGILHGCVLLMMAPVMFWSISLGAILSEIVTLLIYKSYEREEATVFGAALFIPMTLPTTLLFTMTIHGQSFIQVVEKPIVSLALCVATVLLGYIGAKLGQKIGKELQKAGKL
jgi:energy-coupling factor transport system substrate-specific component